MYEIPDGLPRLSKEAHQPGDGKACVMEYISVITGEAWTDHPTCTDPIIATTAIALNDFIDNDTFRSEIMVPFIGRLIGTTHPGPDRRAYKTRLAQAVRMLNPQRFDELLHRETQRCGCLDCHHPDEQRLHYVCSTVAHRFTGTGLPDWVVVERLQFTLCTMLDIADREFGRTKRQTDTAQKLTELVAELAVAQ